MKKELQWTDYQLKYLREHYPEERAEDVGAVIGKSKLSVQHKAFRLGIKKSKEGISAIRHVSNAGANCGNFKNYRRRTPHGYINCYRPEHPNATKDGLVMEHRLVAEKYLGCYLPKEFDVHHINGKKDDNRIENLAILIHGAHTAIHNRKGNKVLKGKNSPLYKEFDVEKARRLKEAGLSVDEICDELGVKKTKYYREMRDDLSIAQ